MHTIIPWQKLPQFGYRWRNRVKACSNGPLVYVGTLKCAHTFFYNNLINNYKWSEIRFSEIDWSTQRVFGHLLDPVERRYKALAEYLCMTGTQDLWYSNPNFQQLINSVTALDEHSMSYHETYGNYMWMIDWIPLDTNHANVIHLTDRLMYAYGQILTKWDLTQAHIGSTEKVTLARDMRTYRESQERHTDDAPAEHINIYLERDIELNRVVTKHFNQQGKAWGDISWLRDRLLVY